MSTKLKNTFFGFIPPHTSKWADKAKADLRYISQHDTGIVSPSASECSKMLQELETAEKHYRDNTQKACETAFKAFLTAMALTDENTETITRTVTDSKTGRERTIQEYVDLKIPKFSFIAQPELDPAGLAPFLSDNALAVIAGLTAGGISRFAEVREILTNPANRQTTEATHKEEPFEKGLLF